MSDFTRTDTLEPEPGLIDRTQDFGGRGEPSEERRKRRRETVRVRIGLDGVEKRLNGGEALQLGQGLFD